MGIWDIIKREEYDKWAKTAEEPCIHNYLAHKNLLQIIQHDSKIYAGNISQQRQHEQNNYDQKTTVMVTA